MRAFKPTVITDTNFTNNIPEPDGRLNEVEWYGISDYSVFAPANLRSLTTSSAGGFWYKRQDISGAVYKGSKDFTALSSITVAGDIYGVAYDGVNTLNVLTEISGEAYFNKYKESTGEYLTQIAIPALDGLDLEDITIVPEGIAVLISIDDGGVPAGEIRVYNSNGVEIDSMYLSSTLPSDRFYEGLSYADGYYYIVYTTEDESTVSKVNYKTGVIDFSTNASGTAISVAVSGGTVATASFGSPYEIVNLLASNLSEAWSAGDTAIVSSQHKVYQAVTDNNTNPVFGVNNGTWVEVGATNKYAAFDANIGNKTISAEGTALLAPEITMTYDTGSEYITSVAGFGIEDAVEVTVEVDDGTLIYSNTFDVTGLDRFTLIDLPQAYDADITITITGEVGEGNTVKVGEIVIGEDQYIGVTQYDSSYQLLDNSRVTRDEFGTPTIIQRGTSDIMTFNIKIEASSFPTVRQTMESFRSTPAVWVGDDTDASKTVYGIYEDLTINWSSPSLYDCSFRIQGLT